MKFIQTFTKNQNSDHIQIMIFVFCSLIFDKLIDDVNNINFLGDNIYLLIPRRFLGMASILLHSQYSSSRPASQGPDQPGFKPGRVQYYILLIILSFMIVLCCVFDGSVHRLSSGLSVSSDYGAL